MIHKLSFKLTFLNRLELICLHTVKWFQALLSNDNSVCFVWFYGISTLSGAGTAGQSKPESNDNEWVLCIPQSSSITRTSLSDCLESYPGLLLGMGYYILPLCKDAISVFNSPS